MTCHVNDAGAADGCAGKKEKMMRIHAMRTGTVAIRERQRRGEGRGALRLLRTALGGVWTELLPIWSWVIEHPEGVIVVDTGVNARMLEPGYFTWWNPYFRRNVRVSVGPEEEIGPRLRGLGIAPEDVRWVVLTHLHMDHDGGLKHFPNAEILVSREEHRIATGPLGKVAGYLPHRWPSWFAPRLVDLSPQPSGPFPRSLALTAEGDVRLVGTEGHSAGHMSVIISEEGRSLFIAGDTSYTEGLMLEQAVDGVSPRERIAQRTLGRVLRYAEEVPTVYLPSHDPGSAARLAGRVPVRIDPRVYAEEPYA
jgi:N-acyl homoserine lactone hydrolase